MPFNVWWQQFFKRLRPARVRRKSAPRPSRRMEVEVLEGRLVPASIYVTGKVTNSINSTDPGRFDDGIVSSLKLLSPGVYLAKNLRSAVAGSTALKGSNTIFLDTTTPVTGPYEVFNGELLVQFGASTSLTIKNRTGKALSTIDASEENRVFEVLGGGTTIFDHLEITDGVVNGTEAPGIRPLLSSLSANDAVGGGILNEGSLTLTFDCIDNNTVSGLDGNSDFTAGRGLGGGIYNAANANLTMSNCTVDSNIANGGQFNNDSVFGGNGGDAAGGGLFSEIGGSGKVRITASTFSNNKAFGGAGFSGGEGNFGGDAVGGAIALGQFRLAIPTVPSTTGPLALQVLNSTFTDNSVQGGFLNSYGGSYGGSGGNGEGGAIDVEAAAVKVQILNSTLVLNSAFGGGSNGEGDSPGSAFGGAIAAHDLNSMYLINDTIARNQVLGNQEQEQTGEGGGVANLGNSATTVNVLNTIIAENVNNGPDQDTTDISGKSGFNSLGHNLIGNDSGATGFTATGDITNVPVQFDPAGLKNNGGPTQTLGLFPTSPALDSGDNRVVTGSSILTAAGIPKLTTDQRGIGFSRLVHHQVDIGAYEFQMNLDKLYTFKSDRNKSVTFPMPAFNPSFSLLIGSENFKFPGMPYEVMLDGPAPGGGTTLVVNENGTFSFTVPPRFVGTVHFNFRLYLGAACDVETNLVYTATIVVTSSGLGRNSAFAFLGL